MGLGRQDKKLGTGLGAPTTKLQNDRRVSWIHCLTMQLVLTSPSLFVFVNIQVGCRNSNVICYASDASFV